MTAQFVTVRAENQDEMIQNTEQITEYCTDRFIIEAKSDVEISTFSTRETTVFDENLEVAINDVVSGLETVSSDVDVEVTAIEDNSSVIILSEEVNVDEFIQAVEDNLDDDVSIQPDYPVYLNTEETQDAETVSENDEETIREWEENLAQAQELSTGAGARIAVIGSSADIYATDLQDVCIDGYAIVNNYVSNTSDTAKCAIIHRIAPDAQIIPIAAFLYDNDNAQYSNCYTAYTSDIVKGIQYAQNKGAQVVVCDWYTSEYNAYLKNHMNSANMLFISSAESTSYYNNTDGDFYNIDENHIYPACFDIDNMIVVSAIKDDYNLYCNSCYGSSMDLYAWGDNINSNISTGSGSTYNDNGASAANALVAGAAALVIGKNNSSQNLKNILAQSATSVSYMPGTNNFMTYKALDFYDAVMGVTSSKQIEINTPRADDTYFYDGDGGYTSTVIYYADIKQVAAGNNVMAVLMNDGTVKMAYFETAPSSSHPFSSLNSYGNFVNVPGLNNIKEIALSPDGTAFVAIDADGNLYGWGNGAYLGMSTTSYINVPTENTSISNVEAVYMENGTTWIQVKDENDDVRVYSTGEGIFRAGEKYEFGEIIEAKNATYISVGNRYPTPYAAFIKDGKVYVSNSAAGTSSEDTYFTELTRYSSDNTAAIITCSTYASTTTYGVYVLNENGVLQYNTGNNLSSISGYSIDYNIESVANVGGLILAKKDGESYGKSFNTENVYNIGKASNGNIVSGAFINNVSNYGNNLNGYYALFEDGTLYFAPYYNNGYGYSAGDFQIIAQHTFDVQSVNSVMPVDIELEYGDDIPDVLEILDNRAIITLNDGTDVSVPVTWNNTSAYNPTQLGVQTFNGTLTLPENISNTENITATANVAIKAPITEVENFTISNIAYGTELSYLETQLVDQVNVTLSNGDTTQTLPVTWDTSAYNPTVSGEQKIYGTLTLNNSISNPYEKKPITTVVVSDAPEPKVIEVTNPEDISVPYNTSVSDLQLPQQVTVTLDDGSTTVLSVMWNTSLYNPILSEETQIFEGTLQKFTEDQNVDINGKTATIKVTVAEDVVGNISGVNSVYINANQSVPFELISNLPSTVEITVEDGGTTILPVTWDSSSYNPDPEFLVGNQIIQGTVVTNDKITNTNNIPAVLVIQVLSASYEIESLSPSEASITVEYGTNLEEVAEQYQTVQNTINVNAKNIATEEVVPIPKSLEFSQEDNTSFNSEQAGTYDLIARPVLTNNITIADETYFVLHVTVKEKRNISNVQSANVTTYRYTPFSEITIPETTNVSLDDGTLVDIEVEWDEDAYSPKLVGSQIITGTFKNMPVSVQESSLYQPILVITVSDAEYEITQIIDGDIETIDAGLTLDEAYEIISTQSVEAEITTTDGAHTTHTDIPFTLDAENSDYNGEEINIYFIPTILNLPENISNPFDLYYELIVDVWPVDVDSETQTEFEKTVPRGIAFADLALPTEVAVQLTNGKTVNIPITWEEDDYQPNSEQSIISGVAEWPDYINGYDVEFQYTIDTIVLDSYTLTAIAPTQLPADGSTLSVKLGTTLEEIKNMLETNTVTVTLSDSSGATHEESVEFELLSEDNLTYSTAVIGTYALQARLVLPNNVSNPDNIMLTINVETYVKTVKSITSVRVSGVTQGTEFEDIDMPETVSVTFTDNTKEDVSVTWDGSTYDSTKTGNQRITGTLNCPTYIVNPNNRTASAVVTVVAPATTQLLSLTPQPEVALFSLFSLRWEEPAEELPEDLVEHKYVAEYLNEDGTITEEEISLFEIIE